MINLASVKTWIGGHKLLAGGIGAGALGGGALVLRKAKPASGAGANYGKPAKLVVGRSNAARVSVALHEVERHHHKQPDRHKRKKKMG